MKKIKKKRKNTRYSKHSTLSKVKIATRNTKAAACFSDNETAFRLSRQHVKSYHTLTCTDQKTKRQRVRTIQQLNNISRLHFPPFPLCILYFYCSPLEIITSKNKRTNGLAPQQTNEQTNERGPQISLSFSRSLPASHVNVLPLLRGPLDGHTPAAY